LIEITPIGFVQYIQNYTNWDLLGMLLTTAITSTTISRHLMNFPMLLLPNVGRRIQNLQPVPLLDVIRYPIEVKMS